MTYGGWIGVDLDGTLAHYDGWRGIEHVGEPIPLMFERVQKWVAQGVEVRIFTARVSLDDYDMNMEVARHIQDWCERHGLPRLKVTCRKDLAMIEIWDDRAVRVRMNTGEVY